MTTAKLIRVILSNVDQPVPSRDTVFKVCFTLATKIVEITEQIKNFVVDDNNAEKIFNDKAIATLPRMGLELKL